MVRKLKAIRYKPPKKVVPKDKRTVTPLVYYGGKSRDADFILQQFPPHDTFCDLFGGGGAVVFAKYPSVVDIYNDIGNVSLFFQVLRDSGDELYELLYNTPFSRNDYYECRQFCIDMSQKLVDKSLLTWEEKLEWARSWYVVIMQSFSHEEKSNSWKTTKTMDLANTWNTHVDDLPRFIERLRTIIVENLDFMKALKLYDSVKTLFYIDPPYTSLSRSSQNNYVNEMSVARHKELLTWLNTELKGQAVVSMYSDPLYEDMLKNWRRVSITHRSQIHNSNHDASGNVREEIVWIREHAHGLWTQEELFSSSHVSGVQITE